MKTLIIGLIAAMVAASAWGDVTIVQDGKSEYVIAIPPQPTACEQLAADELAKYIKQMSGAELKVQQGRAPANAIVIAEGSRADGLTQSVRLGDLPQGDMYATWNDNGQIVIVGGRGRSTLLATYALLDAMGCRFLAPAFAHYHGAAEVVPQSKTLVVPATAMGSRQPRLTFRKLYVEEGHSHNAENLNQLVEWMAKLGYNTLVIPTDYGGNGRVKWDNWREALTPELQKRDITIEVGGHGYQNFLNAEMEGGQLFSLHPEYFGADKQGKRHREKGWALCTSNEQAVEYLTINVVKYLRERPEIQIFDFWPPDGAKWCQCKDCEALGTPSDRQALLVHHVGQKVHEARPDLRLEIIAYAAALRPPEHVKLDKEVLLDFCPIGQQFDHQIFDESAEKNADYVKNVTAWRVAFDGDISIYSYYRKYAWDSLPVVIPHYMQKDLQWYAKVPVQGVSCYSEPDDWFTYELNHYVLAALAWTPDVDVDAVINKFCEARYGAAAKLAHEALMLLEETTRNYCSVPNTSLKGEQDVAAALARLNEVLARQVEWSDPLGKLRLMLEYARQDLEIQKLRASGGSKDEIKTKAEAVHEFVQQHAEDGVFLVKDHRLGLPRMMARYGAKE